MTPPEHRLNAIAPYFTMYPLSFPLNELSQARPGEWVLDPFCGRGTTNFAARLLGLPSAGIDSNPVAAAVARSKIVRADADGVIRRCKELLASVRAPREVPEGEFWELAYHRETLLDICRLRESLMSGIDEPEDIMLKALVLGILHGPRHKGGPGYLSNQMPRTYATKPGGAVAFWRKRGLRPERINLPKLVERRARYTLAAVPETAGGEILQKDSREKSSFPRVPGGYRRVVTSPPYWGMRSYIPDQWLRNWFLGADHEVCYSQKGQLRHGGLGNFIEDLARVWENCAAVAAPEARMHIRFGALPSVPQSPEEILRSSIEMSRRWRVAGIRASGIPKKQRRQSNQFVKKKGEAIEEIDMEAVLS